MGHHAITDWPRICCWKQEEGFDVGSQVGPAFGLLNALVPKEKFISGFVEQLVTANSCPHMTFATV